MRPIIRGDVPKDDSGLPKVYSEYGEARRDLIAKIGRYCSYCERRISSSLHIEHVQPKDANPHLRCEWSNFLLACVNCNSHKGSELLILSDYYWPDSSNTYRAINYEVPGYVLPGSGYNVVLNKTAATIDLTGLDVVSLTDEATDTRFEERLEAYFIAMEELDDFNHSSQPTKEIAGVVRTALGHGFWSVWMKVFENHPAVLAALITAFDGTDPLCLSTDINRNPIP